MNRKLVSLACALVLSVSVVAAAAAETVPGSVYGTHGNGKGENTPTAQVAAGLQSSGVTDVKPTDWYAGSTVVLLQAGLIQPSASGELHAEAPVDHDTTLAIFSKALGLASKTDDAATAAAKAEAAGFAPAASSDGTVSRMELARMLAKVLGVAPKPGAKAFADSDSLSADDNALLAGLKDAGYVIGFEDGTFRGDSPMTLAQVAVIIDRILSAKH
jgi:hypothetical protein